MENELNGQVNKVDTPTDIETGQTKKTPKIEFKNHDKYIEGVNQIFNLFKCDPETQEFLKSVILCKNSTVLLSGVYGTGKSLLIKLIGKTFFSDSFGTVRFRDTLTEFDIIFFLDIAKITQGIEDITPRRIVTTHFKWINEVQRGNPKLYNALLSLLAEHEVEYRNTKFKSPEFLCFMDRNPKDVASVEIPRAFFDRIDFSIDIPVISMKESYDMLVSRFVNDYVEDLLDNAISILKSEQMVEIWKDVDKIQVPPAAVLYLNLIAGLFSSCIKLDKSTLNPKYNLDHKCDSCEFKGEICYNLKEVLGERWKISTLNLAKGHAWLNKREKVNLDDINFAIIYALPHRVQLKGSVYAIYPNEFTWVKENLRKAIKVKKRIWLEAIDTFRNLKDENRTKELLDELKKLSIKDLSINQLYQWALQIVSSKN